MSDSLPDPQGDVEHLLVQTLEDEERRLSELEARVARLSSAPQPRSAEAEGEPPLDPSVTQADLEEARTLLAQSGEHLRELQGRLTELEGGPLAKDEDSTDRFQLVLGPGDAAHLERVQIRDDLDVGVAQGEGFLPAEPVYRAEDLQAPATHAGWSGAAQQQPSASVPPVTREGWGQSTPLPIPEEVGVPQPSDGFRSAEVMPPANEFETPATSAGWGGDQVAPVASHPQPEAYATPSTHSGWGQDPAPSADAFGARVEDLASTPNPPPAREGTEVFRAEAPAPTAEQLATPATSAGWVDATPATSASWIDDSNPIDESSDLLAIQVPQDAPQPTIEPPNEAVAPVVLPPPADVIEVPQPTPAYLISAGPAAVAGQVAAAAATSATVPPDADRFDLGNKFGSGREPALRELWKNQERILQRLEAITDQVGNLVQAQADEVAHLRLRAERAERICTQAFSQAQTRASRWEAAVSGLAARSEVHTRAADPAPGSTQQLVRLLRDAITAQPEPVPEPEPQKPDPLEVLRERLFAMGNEHQSLVQRHASLLENLLGLLDPEDD